MIFWIISNILSHIHTNHSLYLKALLYSHMQAAQEFWGHLFTLRCEIETKNIGVNGIYVLNIILHIKCTEIFKFIFFFLGLLCAYTDAHKHTPLFSLNPPKPSSSPSATETKAREATCEYQWGKNPGSNIKISITRMASRKT